MKKIFFLFVLVCGLFVSCDDNEPTLIRAGIQAFDYVKEQMIYPEETETTSQILGEQLSAKKFKVIQRFTAKNAFGVKTSYVYLAIMLYVGDGESEWTNDSNWECESLVIENEATGEQHRF